ncbi:hypothetical protein MRB53_039873 [Persea americana]|nr:hypothetical protein MRB53_039873 [Persea americana]
MDLMVKSTMVFVPLLPSSHASYTVHAYALERVRRASRGKMLRRALLMIPWTFETICAQMTASTVSSSRSAGYVACVPGSCHSIRGRAEPCRSAGLFCGSTTSSRRNDICSRFDSSAANNHQSFDHANSAQLFTGRKSWSQDDDPWHAWGRCESLCVWGSLAGLTLNRWHSRRHEPPEEGRSQDGVILGADSRTTTGAYIANRVTDKLTQVHDTIWCCRSGSAADTQAVADIVHYYLGMYGVANAEPPTTQTAAALFQELCYSNKDQLRQTYAIGGSGSTYIYGYCDSNWKEGMSEQDGINFVKGALQEAIKWDGSSGGVIRMVVLTAKGAQRHLYLPDNGYTGPGTK